MHGLLLCLVVAAADDAKLAVTPLDGLGVEPVLLTKLDRALLKQVVTLGMNPVETGPGTRPCDGNPACLAALGTKVGASRVLAGSVGLAGDEVHVALKIIDVASKTEAKALDDAAPADQAERRVRAAAMKLLAPDLYNTSGALVVATGVSGAEVVVDGVPRGTTPLFGPIAGLPPGRREVEVRYAEAKSWRGFVDVGFDEAYELALALRDGALVEVPRGGGNGTGNGGGGGKPRGPSVMLLSGTGAVAAGLFLGIGAFAFGLQAMETKKQIELGVFDQADIDANKQAAFACGTLTGLAIASAVAGAGLIGFSFVE